MFLVIILISIYNFGIYLILVLSICNAIQSADCHVRYFKNKGQERRIYILVLAIKGVKWYQTKEFSFFVVAGHGCCEL